MRPPVPIISVSWAQQSLYPEPSESEEIQGNAVVADIQGELSILDVLLPLDEEVEDITPSNESDVSGVQNFDSHTTDAEETTCDAVVTETFRRGVPAYSLERLTDPLPFDVLTRYIALPDELRAEVTYVALFTTDAQDHYVRVDASIIDLNNSFNVAAYFSEDASPPLAYIFEE